MRSPYVWMTLAVGLAACGGHTPDGDDDDGGGPSIDARSGVDATIIDAPPLPRDAKVYAHSSGVLYAVDPDTLAVSLVAPFRWPSNIVVDSMTDIALDAGGN